LTALGAQLDHDIVVRCALSAEDSAGVPAALAALEDSGVTWVLEGFPPGTPPDRVADVVANGPPGAS
jgi:hypothetical protein